VVQIHDSHDFLEGTGGVAEVVLPKAEDAPAEAAEGAVDEEVAGTVAS
jgi:hypothetical protein